MDNKSLICLSDIFETLLKLDINQELVKIVNPTLSNEKYIVWDTFVAGRFVRKYKYGESV